MDITLTNVVHVLEQDYLQIFCGKIRCNENMIGYGLLFQRDIFTTEKNISVITTIMHYAKINLVYRSINVQNEKSVDYCWCCVLNVELQM